MGLQTRAMLHRADKPFRSSRSLADRRVWLAGRAVVAVALVAALAICATAQASEPVTDALGVVAKTTSTITESATQAAGAPTPTVSAPVQAVTDVARSSSAVGTALMATAHQVAEVPAREATEPSHEVAPTSGDAHQARALPSSDPPPAAQGSVRRVPS